MPTDSVTNNMTYDSRSADKFVVRLTEGLRSQILIAAKKHHRSMNSEIIARIDESLDLEAKYEEMRYLESATDYANKFNEVVYSSRSAICIKFSFAETS